MPVNLLLKKLRRRKRKSNKRRRKLLLRPRKTDQIMLHQPPSQRLSQRNPNQFHQLQPQWISHQSLQVLSVLKASLQNWQEPLLKERNKLSFSKDTEFRKRVIPTPNHLIVMTNEQPI